MVWGKNGTPHTLGSAGDTLQITDLTATKFNQFMIHTLTTAGTIKHNFRFDNNSNTDYSRTRSNNGAADSPDTNQPQIEYFGDGASDKFEIVYSCNTSGREKLNIHCLANQNAVGAANHSDRAEAVSKCDTTTNSGQYTRIDCFEDVSGQYDTGSNITGLGSEINVIANNFQDGAVYYDKQLNKEYVLNNNTWKEL